MVGLVIINTKVIQKYKKHKKNNIEYILMFMEKAEMN